MSELFTVKVDLSSVSRDENEKLYILMIDPLRMKMIFQFKLWIRFLFSIEYPIKLLYEDAALHDLEDIHILKVLRSVRVEGSYYCVGEKERLEEIVSKINKYDEWRESITPAITPQKQCELLNGGCYQTANGQFQPIGVSHVENKLNSSSEGYERRNEHAAQYSACSGSQTITKKKSGVLFNNLNTSSNSCSYNEDETDIASYCNKSMNSVQSQKDDCSNVVYKTVPKIINDSGKTSCSKSIQKSSFKATANKPFSIFNFLESLKIQESKTVNNHEFQSDSQPENIDFKTSEVKLEDKVCIFEEESNLIRRKRKRIRRRKNQKSDIYSPSNITAQTMTSVIPEKQRKRLVSVVPRPKHIRFDADEGESEGNLISNRTNDESFNMKSYSNEYTCNSEVEVISDQKFDVIPSVEHDDFMNQTSNASSAIVEVIKETPVNEVDIKNMSINGNAVEVKSDSPQSILDVLESLKKKSNTPPIFNRFDNCL